MYDRKHDQLIRRRQEVQEQLERHNSGDEEFRMAVSTLVSIASKALDIFDRSTTDEKRQLIGYVFSNLELKGAKLCYTLKTPFDLLVNLTSYQKWPCLQSSDNYSLSKIAFNVISFYQKIVTVLFMLQTPDGKKTFSNMARDYDAARPSYPDNLIQEYIKCGNLLASSSVLEIGCGTGQLTRKLAPYNFRINAIDIGEDLINITREHCKNFPNIRCVQSTFEDLEPKTQTYDSIVCATAFHWLDPDIRFQKCASLLKPDGTLAIIQNISKHSEHKNLLRDQLDLIYKDIIPENLSKQYQSLESKNEALIKEFEESGYWTNIIVRRFPYVYTLNADQYIRLLNTFSYQNNLPLQIKTILFEKIKQSVLDNGNIIDLPYEATLIIGNKQKE